MLDLFTSQGVSKELDSGKSTCRKLQSGRGIGKSVRLPEEIGTAYQNCIDRQKEKYFLYFHTIMKAFHDFIKFYIIFVGHF